MKHDEEIMEILESTQDCRQQAVLLSRGQGLFVLLGSFRRGNRG